MKAEIFLIRFHPFTGYQGKCNKHRHAKQVKHKELTEKIKADREMASAYEQDKSDFDNFAAVILKYVGY